MSATRRRPRVVDPLASPSTMRSVCHLLRERVPDVILPSEKGLIRFLYAVRHVERRPTTDTRRGRPSRCPRKKLVEAASHLRGLLERETLGRVSVNSFIGQYLPLLTFPSDVTDDLAAGRVNLRKPPISPASHPNASTAPREPPATGAPNCFPPTSPYKAPRRSLRTRVRGLLGESVEPDIPGGLASAVSTVYELLDVDPFAMREVEPEDLDDETVDDFPRRWIRSRTSSSGSRRKRGRRSGKVKERGRGNLSFL